MLLVNDWKFNKLLCYRNRFLYQLHQGKVVSVVIPRDCNTWKKQNDYPLTYVTENKILHGQWHQFIWEWHRQPSQIKNCVVVVTSDFLPTNLQELCHLSADVVAFTKGTTKFRRHFFHPIICYFNISMYDAKLYIVFF